MNGDIRRSSIAGSWYPGSPKVLRDDIEGYLKHASVADIHGKIMGLVAPHAGYVYSGGVAAYAYKSVRGKPYDTVIVISPSHRMAFPGASVYHRGGYETPLGVVPVNTEMSDALINSSSMISDTTAPHAQEHALEIQLPFLQIALGQFLLVPVIMGSQDRMTCESLAKSIYEAIGDQQVLIVGSSDLSHFHDYQKAVDIDRNVLQHLNKMDAAGLLNDLKMGRGEACGGGPAAVTMMVVKMMGADNAKVLHYANSGDVSGEKDRVVGYAAAVFWKH
jgi:AmmeMemoRadiSam system protein B